MKIIIARHAEPDYIHDTITEKEKGGGAARKTAFTNQNRRDLCIAPWPRKRHGGKYFAGNRHAGAGTGLAA